LLDLLKLLVARFAFVPRLEGDEEEAVVAGADKAEKTEANDAGGVLDAGGFVESGLNFTSHFVGALERSGVG
jgi:hypothetical protein